MIHIDGSQGEGGGQVLRSALSLAVITGKAIRIDKIRARRPKPGLMAQHLQAVQAAAAISEGRVEGAKLGSTMLTFEPQGLFSGTFRFEIGTAGSTSLVLQTILVPLSLAGGASQVTIRGGTHVPWSPSFHYLQRHWQPMMRRIGFDFDLELVKAGFYPRGGGEIRCRIRPAGRLLPLILTERGACRGITGISAVAMLDERIAERQRAQMIKRLGGEPLPILIEIRKLAAGSPGTMLLFEAEFEWSRWCTCTLGARGKPAERVADEAVEAYLTFVASGAAVDSYLADQLVLALALAHGTSELYCSDISQHLLTNAGVISAFIPVAIEIRGALGVVGWVHVEGAQLN
ncbi:MAG TPA: RNA 3'-phosphate cyclase [Syntrophobacteraceae bacterium]|nr:RNA 3'-phosphate cyclase [Syntrophobacteraceae bacterium]